MILSEKSASLIYSSFIFNSNGATVPAYTVPRGCYAIVRPLDASLMMGPNGTTPAFRAVNNLAGSPTLNMPANTVTPQTLHTGVLPHGSALKLEGASKSGACDLLIKSGSTSVLQLTSSISSSFFALTLYGASNITAEHTTASGSWYLQYRIVPFIEGKQFTARENDKIFTLGAFIEVYAK